MKWEFDFLKLTTIAIAVAASALSVFGIVQLIRYPINPDYRLILYPIVIGLITSALPFVYGLINLYRVLVLVQHGNVNRLNILRLLGVVRGCAYAFACIYFVLLPFDFFLADRDDAPGLILFGTAPIFVALVVIAVTRIVQKHLKKAMIEL